MITGAGGFIASHLVERLAHEGEEVVALCKYNSKSSFGWLDGLQTRMPNLTLEVGDVRDPGFVRSLIQDGDVVFHLAALIGIPYSYLAPRSYLETNLLGTLNLLEAAIERKNVRVIHTSTSEVYGTPQSLPITESHPISPQSPYAASKASADSLCKSFAASFDVDVRILRPFNTYGPRQSLRAVIPTVMSQLIFGDGVVRLGRLDPKRDFTFVDDTVDGFVRIARADVESGSVVQLGTGSSYSIREVIEICEEVTGIRAEIVLEPERVRPKESEVAVLLSDPSLAGEALNWKPRHSLRQGIEKFGVWLKDTVSAGMPGRYHI